MRISSSRILTETGRRGQHRPKTVGSLSKAIEPLRRGSVVCVAISRLFHIRLPINYVEQRAGCRRCRHENPLRRWSRLTVRRAGVRAGAPARCVTYRAANSCVPAAIVTWLHRSQRKEWYVISFRLRGRRASVIACFMSYLSNFFLLSIKLLIR